MNDGNVCISVHAATVDEFVRRVEAARGKSDLIELRFDYLDVDELGAEDDKKLAASLHKIFGSVSTDKCITTFRPIESGGHREISPTERDNFWNAGFETEFADLEEDMVELSWYWLWWSRICSFHDFGGVPEDLYSIFERLKATGVPIVKIAASINDVIEAIPIWRLLEDSKVRVIPIAMGEAGKWTRILGLAHGAPITYAALDAQDATAPGQITAADLQDVFRVKELDMRTDVYAVIAGNTSYSLSPYMHNAAFKQTGLNSVFVPMQVADLDGFMRRMVKGATREVELNFKGFSVTNPHKQTVMKHLDRIDDAAQKIGAVNTVNIEHGKLHGYNTDAAGFIEPLKKLVGDLRDARVTVAGAGGAARACIYALKNEGADVTLVARDPNKAAIFASEFGVSVEPLTTEHRPLTTDILVNATPLGTRGENANEAIATADKLSGVKLVYDLVYNPSETRLLREAKIAGAKTIGGLDMLVAQGAKQFEIWTGQTPPVDTMRDAIESRLK